MSGHVLQVNISRGGLPKRPIFEGALGTGGFEGDAWAHPEVHGGFGQAVLLIAAEAIQELAARGYPVFPGALGENITTEGLDRRKWRSGQRFRVGAARIELTKDSHAVPDARCIWTRWAGNRDSESDLQFRCKARRCFLRSMGCERILRAGFENGNRAAGR